ncbi:hypothetical protein, partial [Rhodospirillum sp. A1_3_36]|uniref:hypothetical protein n=1 Tax=Rhodospirillum sp. A1_3_36 TaxID=3391666 RepID=UPI0039A43AD6
MFKSAASAVVVAGLFAPILMAQEPEGIKGEECRGSLYSTSVDENGHITTQDVSGMITPVTTMFTYIESLHGDRMT